MNWQLYVSMITDLAKNRWQKQCPWKAVSSLCCSRSCRPCLGICTLWRCTLRSRGRSRVHISLYERWHSLRFRQKLLQQKFVGNVLLWSSQACSCFSFPRFQKNSAQKLSLNCIPPCGGPLQCRSCRSTWMLLRLLCANTISHRI